MKHPTKQRLQVDLNFLTALPFLGVPCDERGVDIVFVVTDVEAEDDPRQGAPHRLAALPGHDTSEVEGPLCIHNKETQHYCTKNNSTYAGDDGTVVKAREVGEVQRRHGEQLTVREASLVDCVTCLNISGIYRGGVGKGQGDNPTARNERESLTRQESWLGGKISSAPYGLRGGFAYLE